MANEMNIGIDELKAMMSGIAVNMNDQMKDESEEKFANGVLAELSS